MVDDIGLEPICNKAKVPWKHGTFSFIAIPYCQSTIFDLEKSRKNRTFFRNIFL